MAHQEKRAWITLVVALVLSLLEVDRFWISNATHLGFVLSAVLGPVTTIAGYRAGFPAW